MAKTYTAVIKKDGEWWIGWIEEITGVNCQEHSREELLKSLKITLKEALSNILAKKICKDLEVPFINR